MKNGSELRTQEGRAEVLLTPGTFLRVGPNTAIRMVSNQLDDTRVELLKGSAVLDQGSDTLANTSVTILYNLDQVHIKKPGRYRFDSEPPEVKVEIGDAEVIADGKSIEAGTGYAVAFEGQLTTRRFLRESGDDLEHWNAARDNSVAANNQDAAEASDLGGVIDGWQNNPDAVLQSLGIPPYIPGMSSVGTSGYAPPLGHGSSLYGAGLYGPGLTPYGLYGLGPLSPLFLYQAPLYRSYRSPYSTYGGLTYRSPLTAMPGRTGFGTGVNRGLGPVRSIGPMRPGVGVGVAHPGFGAGHAGGHR
jgi:hypothetical protein